MNRIDLENRLIDFAVEIYTITNSLNGKREFTHLISQILRSSSSSALNYAEAQSAESQRDFVHKIMLVLKELRETSVCLKIISKMAVDKESGLTHAINENNELIMIFVKTWKTARSNLATKR